MGGQDTPGELAPSLQQTVLHQEVEEPGVMGRKDLLVEVGLQQTSILFSLAPFIILPGDLEQGVHVLVLVRGQVMLVD